ncbi:HtaA domain-containing protein [Streptomyces sp. Rer75]|uniref:HtaA domain-containing protein n=1 Tax=unclassified Streptomyces TaxID=2593676 RepID=UPI00211E0FF9|nr:HtaA domain-containing protein [Streptomyces sp. Rer75]
MGRERGEQRGFARPIGPHERQRAAFDGQLRFRGKDLDLALSGVTVRIADGRGTLAADVADRGSTHRTVPLATFPAARLRPTNGLLTLADAPATLTARGARAFGGLYRAGTAMDPVSLAVPVAAFVLPRRRRTNATEVTEATERD